MTNQVWSKRKRKQENEESAIIQMHVMLFLATITPSFHDLRRK